MLISIHDSDVAVYCFVLKQSTRILSGCEKKPTRSKAELEATASVSDFSNWFRPNTKCYTAYYDTRSTVFFWPAWQCSCNHKPSSHPQALAERNAIASPRGKAMHMYPHGNCHPQTIGRKHRYFHFTCLDRGGGLKRRSSGTIKAFLWIEIACG